MNQYTGLSFQARSFQFQNIKLNEACWIDGAPYFTSESIGEWLGYKSPEKDIVKIVEKNPIIKDFRQIIILTDRWGKKDNKKTLEVYNPIGLQIIVNDLNQPGVKDFKKSVSRLVNAFVDKKLTPENTIAEQSKDPRQIAINRLKQIEEFPHGEKGYAMQQLADELGVKVNTLGAWKTQYNKTGKIEDKRKTQSARKTIESVHISRWKKILSLLEAERPRSEIKKKLNVSDSQICRVKNRYFKRWIENK
jgi:hypothetical protein